MKNQLIISTPIIFLGILVLSILPLNVFAQYNQGSRINWKEVCNNPIIDILISEPCSSLTSPDGYTLTKEGERVLLCMSGGALAVVIGQSYLLVAKEHVGCGENTKSSSNSFGGGSSSDNNDPISSILEGLFGSN